MHSNNLLVSILILLEVPLQPPVDPITGMPIVVSILILLEVPLQLFPDMMSSNLFFSVSILILLEVPLQPLATTRYPSCSLIKFQSLFYWKFHFN